jgi:hypothetical protein
METAEHGMVDTMMTSKRYPQLGHGTTDRLGTSGLPLVSVTSTFPSLIECERQANPRELSWSYDGADDRKREI